jgi:signal peptidase I
MRALLFLLLLPMGVLGQELPEKNRLMLEYAIQHRGQKIGRGICNDLVREAADHAGVPFKVARDNYRRYGKRVSHKKILPGDVVEFRKVTIYCPYRKINFYTEGHIGIVYKVTEDGWFEVIQQNVTGSLKNSRVVVSEALSYEHRVKGKVRFYRPVDKF